MQLQQPFNARAVEPSSAPQPLPDGPYKVIITESSPEMTKDSVSGMLVLNCRVQEGQYQGREFKYYLNLWNQSKQASEIAHRQLSSICHVVGVFDVAQTEQLHGIPFAVMLKTNSAGYNEVKYVMDLNGNQPGKAGSTAVAAAPAPTAPPAGTVNWPANTAAPAAQPAAWSGAPLAAAPTQPSAPPAAAAPWGPPAPPAAASAPAWGSQPPAAPAPVAPAPAAAPWSPGPTGMPPASTPPWGK